MIEEIQKLRSLNKHRDDIINQMENQNKNLRETETQLKLTQNDYELLHNLNKSLEMKVKDLQEKLDPSFLSSRRRPTVLKRIKSSSQSSTKTRSNCFSTSFSTKWRMTALSEMIQWVEANSSKNS